MATGERLDPVGNYNFFVRLLDAGSALVTAVENLLGIDSKPDAGFNECRGLEGTLQMQEWPEGGRFDRTLKFPTRMTWGNITLQRGAGLSSEMWDWYFAYAKGRGLRKDGLIMLMNDEAQPVVVWKFRRGLPARWSGPTMSGRANEVAIESLEIAHEGIEVQPGPGLFGL
jgi:phage tail-like protein